MFNLVYESISQAAEPITNCTTKYIGIDFDCHYITVGDVEQEVLV